MHRRARNLLAGGVALAVAAGLAACAPASESDTERSIRIGLPGFQLPVNWDPAGGGFLWFMSTRPVYESLIRWDIESAEYVGWLAEEFEISDDGLTISMRLRDDVDFVDGVHMDAASVVKVLDAALTREGSYFARPILRDGTTIEATGEYTLEIRVAEPVYDTSVLLVELTYLPISSPAVIDDPSLLEDGPVGSGPYVLEELVPEVSATYARNPDYRDPDAYDFDEITLTVYDDKVAALNAMKSGQIDAAEMDSSLAAEAEAQGLVVHTGLFGYITLRFADLAGVTYPETADVRVRRAINLALDQASIAATLEAGYARVSSQPFDPTSPEYVDGGDDRYAYDPDAARALLAEAGHADGFTLTIGVSRGDAARARYGPVIEQYLGEIGIDVEWVEAEIPLAAASNGEVAATLLQDIYPNVVRDVADRLAASSVEQGAAEMLGGWIPGDDEILGTANDYNAGTPAEHAAAQPVLAEYILDQALYAPVSHPEQLWVTVPGIEMHLTNMPSYFITLDSFSAAD